MFKLVGKGDANVVKSEATYFGILWISYYRWVEWMTKRMNEIYWSSTKAEWLLSIKKQVILNRYRQSDFSES